VNELAVTFAGQTRTFEPGTDVGIGRSPHNAIVVTDPMVSREHAKVTWDGQAWVLDDLGKGRTFVGGMAVGSVPVRAALDVRLVSPLGPAVRIELASPQDARAAGGAAAGPSARSAASPATSPAAGTAAGDAPAGTDEDKDRPDAPGPDQAPADPQRGRGQAAGTSQAGAWPEPPWADRPPADRPPADRPPAPPTADSPGGDLATAVHILLPIRSWLKDPGWRQGSRLLVIAYGLLPSLFVVAFSTTRDAAAPGWAYSLAIAPLWAIAFWLLIRPGHITRLIGGIATAIVAAVLILLPVMTLPWENAVDNTADPHNLLPWIYGAGLAEEVTKALPILIAALALRWIWKITLDVRVWMFLGTIAGLAFGVRESVLYTSSYITQGNHQAGVAIPLILTFALRVFVDGFQHAVWAGIAAFFIGIGVNYRRRRIPLILFGIALPAVLHGLNDWSLQLASHWLWILIEALSLFLFIGYTMSAATIERQVRDTPLFRGESMIMDRAVFADDPPERHGAWRG
jgi:RsiW-degrading membrane proteinase PrsW (M82 family)